ncbi:MAG: MFS transporter [Arenibacterium sp.]
MLEVLAQKTFRRLFMAQIVALIGTGLATVSLGLLAYDIAGGNAALVLGLVFTIKMVAYVTIAPIAGAYSDRLPRRATLVSLDLVRAGVALALPFVSEVWQIYLLILALQAASAAFTPTFQAVIPDILPDEGEYTRALSLSRMAYDLEAMISPILAAAALTLVSYNVLFGGTAIGFLASALLVGSVILPNVAPKPSRPIYERTTRGIRRYLVQKELRALLALCFAVSSAISMVLVNTVVLVQGDLGLSPRAVALSLAAFGIGSMTSALLLPRLLERVGDRAVMLPGAALMGISLLAFAFLSATLGPSWGMLLLIWALLGMGNSAVMTPSGRLLRRASGPDDRPELYAAQFALSHACWLISYPMSGALMTAFGAVATSTILGGLALAALWVARGIWTETTNVATDNNP